MAIPGIPTNFILQQGNGQVLLNWDLMAGATSYQVDRSTDGINFTLLASPTTNSFLDTSVTIGTNYFYQIASTNVSGTSSFTAPQSITPTGSGQYTLGQIRLLAQQEADRVNSNFVGVPEWNTYINQSAFELYDLLTTLYEDFYVAPQAIFQTNGTNQFYPLPDGILQFQNLQGSNFTAAPFYKMLGVDMGIALNNNAWVTLRKFNFIERNRYVYPQLPSTYLGVFNLRYRILGNQIEFIPNPAGAQFARLWYIPRMKQLLQDTDILDGVSGWTEYVVVDAAIKALEKEESDITALAARKMALKTRIEESAMNRDAGTPDTVSDHRNFSGSSGRYGTPQGDGSFGGY